jgi:type II secretory pathway pseudopilin PulG
MKINRQKGFSVLEIIVSSAIIVLIVTSIVLSIQFFMGVARKSSHDIQAGLLIEETAEVLLILRDQGWDSNIDTLNFDTDYYLWWDGANYFATTTNNLVHNIYTRKFRFDQVERDAGDSITDNGTIDPDTLLVEINISWDDHGQTQTAESLMLLHNVYQN